MSSHRVAMRHRRIRLPFFALALAALACSVFGSPAATPPPAPSPADSPSPQPAFPKPTVTAFDSVIAMLGPKGEVSPEMALQAFAFAIAPLPGVTPPTGAPGQLDADAAAIFGVNPEHFVAILGQVLSGLAAAG